MALRILHLEDESGYSELVREKLANEWPALEFSRVETREEFASAIGGQKLDVILADYSLPSFDGITALDMAKERLPDVPVIFITGVMGSELAIEALKKGASDVIQKDSLPRIISVIKRALAEAEAHGKLKAAEDAIRESEERFRVVAETAGDAIICLKAPDTVYFWNKKAEEIFGYSLDEIRGRRFHEVVAPEGQRARAMEAIKNFFETGVCKLAGKTIEIIGLRKDGTEFPAELSLSTMKIKGQWHSAGILRDVTARKKAEGEIKARVDEVRETALNLSMAKREWESTFDAIPDPIFIHDKTLKIIRANRAYQAFAGKPWGEIVGKPYYEVFPRMDGPFEICRQKASPADEGAALKEETVSVPELQKVFKVRFYVVRDADGVYQYSVHHLEDITEKKRIADKESVVYELSRNITASLDLDYRCREICLAIVRLGYRMAWTGLLREDTKDVIPVAQAGFEDDYLNSIKIKYDDSPLADGPSGRAIKTKELQVQNNIATDPMFEPWREVALKQGYKSSAAFPIVEKGKVLAVLNVYNALDVFPEKDAQFLQTFANQVAAYMHEARLFKDINDATEKLKQEMEMTAHLLMIAETTTKVTDIERLSADVAQCCHRLMKADISLFYFYEKERKVFVPAHEIGLAAGRVPVFRTEPLPASTAFIKKAVDEKRPAVERFVGGAAGCARLPRCLVSADGMTVITVPFMGRKGPLGVLVAVLHSERMLSEREMKVLEGASRQVSIALDEAAAYRESINRTMELSRKVETIQAMNEIDRSILSTFSQDEILETVTLLVSRVIACDRTTVDLLDREKGGFVYAAGFGCDFMAKGSVVAFDATSTTDVIETGRPECVQNLAALEEILPVEKQLLDDGFLSHVRVPLTVRGEAIGVLTVGAKRVSAFTQDDLVTLEKLAFQISVAIENARLVSDLEELFIGTVKSLSSAMDAKSPWTAGHSERVTGIAVSIGRKMGFDDKTVKSLEIAGLLHDVGKIGTCEEILNKPDRLTDDEMSVIRLHPVKGAEILASIKQMKDVAAVVKHHHEAFDGSGYPAGLNGEDIPLMARILAVADTVDAMGADRPYRKGKPKDLIAAELKRCSGAQFDPRVVEAYLREGLEGS